MRAEGRKQLATMTNEGQDELEDNSKMDDAAASDSAAQPIDDPDPATREYMAECRTAYSKRFPAAIGDMNTSGTTGGECNRKAVSRHDGMAFACRILFLFCLFFANCLLFVATCLLSFVCCLVFRAMSMVGRAMKHGGRVQEGHIDNCTVPSCERRAMRASETRRITGNSMAPP
jgi:hypothetical protein